MKIETKTQIVAPGHHLPFEVVSLVLQGGGALEYLESLSPKRGYRRSFQARAS
jgi:hypothetical protein